MSAGPSVSFKESFRIGGVEFSGMGIKPVSGSPATLVKADEVKDIELRYGFQSHHPVLQAALGIAMICPLLHATNVMLLALVMTGIWMFFNSLSRGYYLLIQTRAGRRKIKLTPKASPSTVVNLYMQLRLREYNVVMDAIL